MNNLSPTDLNQRHQFFSTISIRQSMIQLLREIDRNSYPLPLLGMQKDNYPDRLKITQLADLSFASHEIVAIKQTKETPGSYPFVHLETRYFGLFAPYGPIPIHVTEKAKFEQIQYKNNAYADFLSLLSQRFAIYYYRAFAQMNVCFGHDRPDFDNHFLKNLDKSVGFVPTKNINNIHIEKLRRTFSGIYLQGRRSLTEFSKILSQYFDVDIQIKKRQGRWVNIEQKSTLKKQENRLGKTVLGKRFFDAEHHISIEIGPLNSKEYGFYQQKKERLIALVDICKDFFKSKLVFDVYLKIETEKSMSCRLSTFRLKENSWLLPKNKIHTQLVYRSEN